MRAISLTMRPVAILDLGIILVDSERGLTDPNRSFQTCHFCCSASIVTGHQLHSTRVRNAHLLSRAVRGPIKPPSS